MFKKILIYGLGIFFSKGIVFLLVPVYTRYFSPADYGYYDVLISNLTMIVSISFFEIWSGIIRFIFADSEKPYRPIKSFLIILPFLLILFAGSFVVLAQIMELKFIILSVVYGMSHLLFNVFNSICRGLNRNVDFVISGIISTVLFCGLGLVFVVIFKQGIKSLLLAQIIGYSCAIIYVEIRTKAIRLALKERTTKQHIKDMIVYCIPLMINSFSFLFLGTFNKNIIFQKLGEETSGYYAFVLKFTALLSVLISVFSLAWQETAFQKAENEERDKIYSYYINMFIKIIGLAVCIYCLILHYAAPIIGGKEFSAAIQYIPLAVFGTLISEISGILSVLLAVKKKGKHILLSTVIGAGVNMIIVILLVNHWGINAASIGLCIGFLCAAIYRYVASKGYFDIKIDFRFLLIVLVEMAITFLCYYFIKLWIMLVAIAIFAGIWFLANRKLLIKLLIKFKIIHKERE